MISLGNFGYTASEDLTSLGASANESALQRALVSLARSTNDASLGVKVDGIVGPATAAITNRALLKYATRAPANYRTGRLTVAQVRTNAGALANILSAEAKARGQKAPPTTAVKPKAKVKAPAPARMPTNTPAAVRTAVNDKAAVAALQNAIRALGDAVGDRVLRIGVDGIAGQGTAAGVNRALTKYVTNADRALRTGKLTVAQIRGNAKLLTTVIVAETAKRKTAKPKAKTKAAMLAPGKMLATRANKSGVAGLQEALALLGRLAKDPILGAIKADGIVGPATARAVNRAFTSYIDKTEAPAQYRTGKLTTATVIASLGPLTTFLRQEIDRQQTAEASAADETSFPKGNQSTPNQSAPVPASPTGKEEANAWDEAAPEDRSAAPAPVSANAKAAQAKVEAAQANVEAPAEPEESEAPAPSEAPSPPPRALAPARNPTPSGGGSSRGGGGGGGSSTSADDGESEGGSGAATTATKTPEDAAANPDTLPGPAPKKAFPWLWVGIGVGGAAVVGVGAWLLLSGDKPRKAAAVKAGPTAPTNSRPTLHTTAKRAAELRGSNEPVFRSKKQNALAEKKRRAKALAEQKQWEAEEAYQAKMRNIQEWNEDNGNDYD